MSHLAHNFLQHLPPSDLCNRSIKMIERWKKHHVLVGEMEVIHDGWLIKLSSDRCLFRRKKWNRYWFVLHSAHNSGQIILEYYKDSNCHNLRGRIDLGQCEQLDSGLRFDKKENIGNNGFDIRTGNKTYYLIAETETEMDKWVGCISSVCGLKRKVEDDQAAATSLANGIESVTSPPSTLSAESEIDAVNNQKSTSPYILISECFTGKPLPNWPSNVDNSNYSYPRETSLRFPFSNTNYDYPKPTSSQGKKEVSFQNNFIDELYQVPPPPRICETDLNNKTYSYLKRPSSDSSQEMQMFEGINLGNSIFMYNSGPAIYHENSDIEVVRKDALQLAQQLESLGLDDCSVESENSDSLQTPSSDCTDKLHFQSKDDDLDTEVLIPPPRPPKPPDLHKRKSPNLTPFVKKNNEFDFSVSRTTDVDGVHYTTQTVQPVSNNALQPHSETPPVLLDEMYDIPKPRSEDSLTILLTASGLHSKENIHVYDNAPPMFTKFSILENEEKFSLNQEVEAPLKFLEQSVESNMKDSSIISQDKSYNIPPLVDRDLKPKRTVPGEEDGKFDDIPQPFDLGNCTIEASSNHSDRDKGTIDLDTSVERPLLPKTNEIQYLDLSLDGCMTNDTSKLEASLAERTTVYKTVDFLRTEAFNKMRQTVEAAYRSSH